MADATRQKDPTKDSGAKERDASQASTSKDTGKEPVKKTARSNKDKKVSSEKDGSHAGSQNQILLALQAIQQNQEAADAKFEILYQRVGALEQYGPEEGYDYDYEEGEVQVDETSGGLNDHESRPSSPKRSRFASMSRKLKGHEELGPAIDQTLADNINHVFQHGLEDDQYQAMIKDDAVPRPENCDALVTVKCNKLVWDFLSTNAKFHDKKLQNTETSLIKGSILVAQAASRLAELESEAKEKGMDISSVLDNCQDALSLFGHANKQMNMSRRESLRPEMRSQYSHLCSSSKPVTQWLFGDDIEKDAKEIEDTAKIGHKMQYEPMVGRFQRGRPAFRGRFPRGRGGFRPRGATGFGGASGSYDAKNPGRRGNFRFPQKRQ